ncbi:MAG: hypothetical protein EP298_10035 [Gammaproteobacteria bacterium]|nr:MAG: hypothetical protein EP298_10035 [Gammaproteobacteria bacterium]UTW41579.1 hypothetical protein KFE69_08670 [bacterium SCSIO 12844]
MGQKSRIKAVQCIYISEPQQLDEVNEHLLQYDLSDKNTNEFLTIVEKIAKSHFHVVPHPFSTEGRNNPKNENKNTQDI